jgi:hypothetical protein
MRFIANDLAEYECIMNALIDLHSNSDIIKELRRTLTTREVENREILKRNGLYREQE